jgi:hypothetical protein
VSLFGINAEQPGTRAVRCVTLDEAGRESAPAIETFELAHGGKTLGTPSIVGPKETTTRTPTSLTVTAGALGDGDRLRIRCLAPGTGAEASQAFLSEELAAGVPATATFTFTTAGPKSVYCTSFNERGGASARRSGLLWLVIGAMTLAGPLLLLALRGVIEGKGDKKSERPVA